MDINVWLFCRVRWQIREDRLTRQEAGTTKLEFVADKQTALELACQQCQHVSSSCSSDIIRRVSLVIRAQGLAMIGDARSSLSLLLPSLDSDMQTRAGHPLSSSCPKPGRGRLCTPVHACTCMYIL